MLTKTKNINEKGNDLETNHSFSIPENIRKDIQEKGFALYNWIGEKDVKQSIERDFLKLIHKLGIFFALILMIPSVLLLYIEAFYEFNFYFFGGIFLINIFLILYLVLIAINRSNILRKNSQILITDSSISINGRINKLNNFIYDIDLKKIGDLFEEDLFKESNIHKSKKEFSKQVINQIKNGYSRIGKDGKQMMILFGALYSVYVLSLGFIYLFGIFFIWIFGNILNLINKKILLITGHEITTINNYFENINKYSTKLLNKKDEISILLKNAQNNEWENSLLTKINSRIKDINKNASDSIDTSIKIKEKIKNSKYNDMFNFSIYNSWIKKQILGPLEQIKHLLEKNLEKLNKNKRDIEKQILETINQSFVGPLIASKTRNEMNIKDIEKHIKGIEIYIDKLK